MSDPTRFPTLLPYLSSEQRCVRLNVARSPHKRDDADGVQDPFRRLSEGSGLSRSIEASWVTQTGSSIQDVFLVAQRDVYPWSGREAGGLCNPTVDAIWRKSYELCLLDKHNGLVILEDQLDADRRLVPFHSLFYCCEKQRFFHPPCPRCGSPLMLCRDDSLLTASRIAPYSQSLKRYLYCPNCAGQEPVVFYAFDASSYDPPCVKDRLALIREFARASAAAVGDAGLPCGACDQRQECHGSPHLITSRIVPLFFYPSFCLMFRAMAMRGSELIVRLAGGTLADVRETLRLQGEMGMLRLIERHSAGETAGSGFLFAQDERFFLEVLYLKLCFLAEAIDKLRQGADLARDVDGFATLDQLWVTLPEAPGQLPAFWSFGVQIADVFHPRLRSISPVLSGVRGAFHSLGLIWLQTLLVNASQDATRVGEALDDLIDQQISSTLSSGEPPTWSLAGNSFEARNLLWSADSIQTEPPWSDLWEEALNLGWSLLMAGHSGGRDWSWTDFQWRLVALRERLKEALFHAWEPRVDSAPIAVAPPQEQSRSIPEILTQILAVWRNRAETEQTASIRKSPPEGSETAAPVAEEDTLPLGLQWKEEEQELAETLVLATSPEQPLEQPFEKPSTEPHEAAPAEEALPETIILKPSRPEGMRVGRTPVSTPKSAPSHPLPEPESPREPATPVPPPEKVRHPGGKPTAGEPSEPVFEDGSGGVDLEHALADEDTFPGGIANEPSSPEGDDFLMETIILTPKKGPETPEKKN